jgi:serine/threonine-protein kinase RsbW
MLTCENGPSFAGCFQPGIPSEARPLGRAPAGEMVQAVIPSDLTEAQRILENIAGLLQANGYDKVDRFAIHLAVDEALVNAIKHGNQMDRAKRVLIDYRVTEERFVITIEDEGSGFDPDELADPRTIEQMQRPCGRGVFLMRHYMSTVVFHPPGRKVTLTRFRSASGPKFDN